MMGRRKWFFRNKKISRILFELFLINKWYTVTNKNKNIENILNINIDNING